MSGLFRVFFEREFDNYAGERLRQLRAEIEAADRDYIAGVDCDRYVEYLVSKYSNNTIVLSIDNVNVSDVPAAQFPPMFSTQPGRQYKKPAVRYHIPFVGDPELLLCKPNPHVANTLGVFAHDNCVCFDLIIFYPSEPEQIRVEAGRSLDLINRQYQYLSTQVGDFNAGLSGYAHSSVAQRATGVQGHRAFAGAPGVPLRKREAANIPIPVVHKKIVLSRPEAGAPAIDPAIEEPIYEEILTLIHGVGRTYERLPSLYRQKDEEALRDHLIPYLESHFLLASATGETFNKSGKTDILMRFEGKNVFIAECKFWAGPKMHFETIDQALSYLSWRDSKAAIIYFVKNKAMSATLESVERGTPSHTRFVRYLRRKEETWFDYEFSLPQDQDRRIRLAVLCFHTPDVGS